MRQRCCILGATHNLCRHPAVLIQTKKVSSNNFQFVCHCDSRYVGCTSQHLEERIKQHVPRSIANPPASPNRQSLSRSCKANTRPQQFYESATNQHLLDNTQCALHCSNEKFSILAQGRSSFHLCAVEATFIKFLNPLLCKQKKIVYSLKIS